MKIILILILIIILLYLNTNYEHMTNFEDEINNSTKTYLDNILHLDICQIQQPQIGKNRGYVNWQKIYDYDNRLY